MAGPDVCPIQMMTKTVRCSLQCRCSSEDSWRSMWPWCLSESSHYARRSNSRKQLAPCSYPRKYPPVNARSSKHGREGTAPPEPYGQSRKCLRHLSFEDGERGVSDYRLYCAPPLRCLFHTTRSRDNSRGTVAMGYTGRRWHSSVLSR